MNLSIPKPTMDGFVRFLMYLFILSLLLRAFGNVPTVNRIREQLIV